MQLGFDIDEREYDECAEILKLLGIIDARSKIVCPRARARRRALNDANRMSLSASRSKSRPITRLIVISRRRRRRWATS